MRKMKRRHQQVLVLLLCLTLICSLNLSAFAATSAELDFTQTGTITLKLETAEGETVSGGVVTIYQVAKLYLDDGDMAYALTDAFKDCTAELDVEDTSLPATLADYVEANGITGTNVEVGSDGSVTFSGLELGLYLIVQTTDSDNYETINPFVVTVPMEDDGVWTYVVDASPKVGTVTPIEPDRPEEPDKPEEPDNPDEPDKPVEPDEPDTPDEPEESEEPEEPVASEEPEETQEPEESDEPEKTEELSEEDEPEESDAPETAPASEDEPTLPKTGQLTWPIPVLAVCGLLFFALGWFLKRTNKGSDQ